MTSIFEFSSLNLWSWATKGGWTMVPLALCSVLAVAIILYRLFAGPRIRSALPAQFEDEVVQLLNSGRIEELRGLCRNSPAPTARIALSALENLTRSRQELVDALEVVGRREALAMQRYLPTLSTIAAISPLIGLLGTVSGMIRTFAVVQSGGIGQATELAGGISEALISTATGLCVAIPSLFFSRMFSGQIKQMVVEMEAFALMVTNRLAELQESPISTNIADGHKVNVRS